MKIQALMSLSMAHEGGLGGLAMNEKLKRMEKLIARIEMKVIDANMFEVSV
jgi:hypothetical protein